MPFQEKPLDDLPRGVTPDVQLIFHGQLILRSQDGQSCEVAVNPVATDHVLSIEARIRKPNQIDRIAMRHLGPLKFRNSEGMLIEVRGGDPVDPAAFKMVGNGPMNLNDINGMPEDDFRWILNLEGELFHDQRLNAPVFASQNVIRLQRGEYFFKTAARPDLRLRYQRRGGNKPDKEIAAIGAIASASVYLGEDQRLVMKWQDATQEQDRTLSLPKLAGTFYEIYIENTPLFLNPPSEAELARRDEFIEYYKLLPDVPAVPLGRRFAVVPEIRPSDGAQPLQEGTPEVPCQVVRLDGPGGG
jgi:hypothetical protein